MLDRELFNPNLRDSVAYYGYEHLIQHPPLKLHNFVNPPDCGSKSLMKFSTAIWSALRSFPELAKTTCSERNQPVVEHSTNGSPRRKQNFIKGLGEDYQNLPAKKNP